VKTALLRQAAKQDLSDAACTTQQGGEALGENLLQAALAALARIEAMPVSAHPHRPACRFAWLRAWALKVSRCAGTTSSAAPTLTCAAAGRPSDIAAILSADPPPT